jgi:hypothetical protein
MKTIQVSIILCLICLLFPLHPQAQITLTQGKKLPAIGGENEWFLNTKDLHIWHVWKGKWSMFRLSRCTNATVCHQFLLLHFDYGTMDLVRASGRQAKPNFAKRFQYQCYDSLSTMEFGTTFVLFDHLGNTLAEIDMKDCPNQQMVNFQGKAAFCVPQYISLPDTEMFACTELKDWGLLGTKGRWLIEPRFDIPFRFENGIAEVVYYGEKRRINEKGEFVK